jgi:hypothetical protein
MACSLKFVLTLTNKFRYEVGKEMSMHVGAPPNALRAEICGEEQREDIERTLRVR